MDLQNPVEDLLRRAEEAGLDKRKLCREAGIAYSTFNRWLSGRTMPNLRSLEKCEEVLATATEPSPQQAAG